jgi:drug/metabolite transporter (DMT)-like permease
MDSSPLMQVVILYTLSVLIWGSTWAAIRFQLGPVAEEVSVAYRFAIASLALFAYGLASRRPLRIPLQRYPMVVVQGVVLFSINYLLVYYGTNFITTGLVAVVFSLIVLSNAFFDRMFFGTPLESRLLLASIMGISGITLIFWPEVSSFSLQDETIRGVLIIVCAVLFASIGNMCAVENTSRGLPVVALNAHAMAWGSVASLAFALLLGREIVFPLQPAYVWSLLYLALFGSAIAFGFYLALIRKIGPARAAYTSVLFPLVALLISTLVEDYRWTTMSLAGVVLILGGNWMAMSKIIPRETTQKDK